MSQTLRISEGAALALHGMALLAKKPGESQSTRQVAAALGRSEAHLSKVFQRLARAGLVTATRGPRGGFSLTRPAGEISLLEVYETIDGPLKPESCLLGQPVCDWETCLLGDLVRSVNEQMRSYLAATTLAQVGEAEQP